MLKRVGIVLLGLVVLIVLAIAGFAFKVFSSSNAILNADYSMQVVPVAVPTDSASIAWGKHLAVTRGCQDCHGADYAGGLQDLGPLGRFEGSNLTAGEGGVGSSYGDDDWVRAIRHGVGPDGSLLKLMPSAEYYYLSDADLGSLIGYLKSLPAVDRTPNESQVGPVGRILINGGKMPALVSASFIPHDAPRPPEPELAVTQAYGEYVSKTCIGCHGEDLTGGINLKPGVPPSTNLTPAGLGSYTAESFNAALRTGQKPDGTMIDPFMPFKQFKFFNDTEVEALWLYLSNLPAKETVG